MGTIRNWNSLSVGRPRRVVFKPVMVPECALVKGKVMAKFDKKETLREDELHKLTLPNFSRLLGAFPLYSQLLDPFVVAPMKVTRNAPWYPQQLAFAFQRVDLGSMNYKFVVMV